MDNAYNFYVAAFLCHSIRHYTIMCNVCRLLPNNDCIENNTKQFKHHVKSDATNQFQRLMFITTVARCFESLGDKNDNIAKLPLLDHLYALIQNKPARISNHCFENRHINQIKHFAQ